MRWHILFPAVACAVTASLAAPRPAHAQYAAYVFMPEVYFGAGLGADFIGNNSDLQACDAGATGCQQITELTGGGFALFAGMRFSEYVGAELTYDAFFHTGSGDDPYNLATIQSVRADAQVFFMAGGGLEPYLQIGGGLYFLGDEYAVAAVGGGFQVGGGLDLYVFPTLSLGANVLYRGIYFEGFDVATDVATVGEAKKGFVHDIYVMVNLTAHYGY